MGEKNVRFSVNENLSNYLYARYSKHELHKSVIEIQFKISSSNFGMNFSDCIPISWSCEFLKNVYPFGSGQGQA